MPGKVILDKLIDDGIIFLKGKFFHLNPDRADQLLQITWEDLRDQNASSMLETYLQAIVNDHSDLF
jgi:hypothetical protein